MDVKNESDSVCGVSMDTQSTVNFVEVCNSWVIRAAVAALPLPGRNDESRRMCLVLSDDGLSRRNRFTNENI